MACNQRPPTSSPTSARSPPRTSVACAGRPSPPPVGCRCVTEKPSPGPTPCFCRPSPRSAARSEEHTSELQSHSDLVCRLLLEKKKKPIHRLSLSKKKNKQRH